MRSLWQRSITLLALYAVALHVVVLGFLPVDLDAYGPLDPFSIICHTIGPPEHPGEPPEGKLQCLPGRGIDRCDLSNAAACPPPSDQFLKIDPPRTRLLDILRPHDATRARLAASIVHPIRGPP